MLTMAERLEKLIAAVTPSKIVFRARKSQPNKEQDTCVFLESVCVEDQIVKVIEEDRELQEALSNELHESWSNDYDAFTVNTTAEGLWAVVKRTVAHEYDRVSKRCSATKRKTDNFIRSIKIDERHLPNYLVQVFLNIRASTYRALPLAEREALFEQFESLRRTYGKRDR